MEIFNVTLLRYITQEELDHPYVGFGLSLDEWYTKFFSESFTLKNVVIEPNGRGVSCVWYDGWCFPSKWFDVELTRAPD